MGLIDLIFRPKKRSLRQAYEEEAAAIETFVVGRGGPWDWDDFTSTKEKDEFLESVRLRCISIRDDFPAKEQSRYCSDEGIDVLRSLAREIRAKIPKTEDEKRA